MGFSHFRQIFGVDTVTVEEGLLEVLGLLLVAEGNFGEFVLMLLVREGKVLREILTLPCQFVDLSLQRFLVQISLLLALL